MTFMFREEFVHYHLPESTLIKAAKEKVPCQYQLEVYAFGSYVHEIIKVASSHNQT
jgi:hypothetical protein